MRRLRAQFGYPHLLGGAFKILYPFFGQFAAWSALSDSVVDFFHELGRCNAQGFGNPDDA